MGKLERAVKIRTRNTKITRAVLATLVIAVAGVLNPQMLVRGILKELKTPKHKQRNSQNAIYAARGRLARQGLIEYREGYWSITESGRRAFQIITMPTFKPKQSRRWDKKWRILIFDIKEIRRALRDRLRDTLSSVGFRKLQNSVWVYPYDCEDFVALLKSEMKIGRDVLYIIADAIEDDEWLKKEFGLS